MNTTQFNGHAVRLALPPLPRILSQAVCALAFLLAGAGTASAGSFQVIPVRVTLSAGKPIAAMTVRNTGGEPAVLQLEVMSWSQAQGKDVYTPTKEILATPPIFTVPAGGSQIVRVGLRRPPDAQRELTYRLYLEEVPPPPKPGFQGLQMALRMGVPLFVPPAAVQLPVLAWRIFRTKEGQFEVGVTNNGNTHVQVANVRLARADGGELGTQQIAGYVLPGQSHNWLLKDIPASPSVAALHLFVQTEAGDIDGGVINVEQK
ncbi:MAG: molecular chaperone [Methylococcales bacterium]|nr:molecular chaperone [Methylococcales bacterium]